ncbi:MAG: 3-hydroxyacyl-CoA dehydrogenase [Robiginitomaculum sp.]|nr:MAG: 3-hydroxyacyl-CoA dehydrogenase [Robiginitomaculum sp.]
MNLEGKTALVTGGGSGIGLACAKRLADDGARVLVAGRNKAALKASGFDYLLMDVTKEKSVTEAFAKAGPIDVLVNNAGAAATAPALKTDMEMWQAMLAVNLTGAFLCAQATIPGMVERGWGRFIVIASTAGLKGYAYTAAYSAAKHGVLGLVKTLAIELAKTGVTVNAICPGFTQTPLLDGSLDVIMKKTGCTQEAALKRLIRDNPMGRAVLPHEVADAVSYVSGTGAGATNGQSIVIDGGESIA